MNKKELEQENRDFEELKRLGVKLHVPIPETFLTLEVFDKDGNPVCPQCSSPVPKDKKTCPCCDAEVRYHQRGHSWTRNGYNLLFSQMAGKDLDDTTFEAGKLSGKDTGGNVKYGNYAGCIACYEYSGYPRLTTGDGTSYGYRATGAEDAWGIIVGSSTTAFSFEDYALATQITEGTGAGQLSYTESSPHAITWTAGTKVLKNDFVRFFNNNTGSSTSVNEVGLVFYGILGHKYEYKYLVARDVLGATKVVADTGQLKATFSLEITYPS